MSAAWSAATLNGQFSFCPFSLPLHENQTNMHLTVKSKIQCRGWVVRCMSWRASTTLTGLVLAVTVRSEPCMCTSGFKNLSCRGSFGCCFAYSRCKKRPLWYGCHTPRGGPGSAGAAVAECCSPCGPVSLSACTGCPEPQPGLESVFHSSSFQNK